LPFSRNLNDYELPFPPTIFGLIHHAARSLTPAQPREPAGSLEKALQDASSVLAPP
jgi:hypothetical protein